MLKFFAGFSILFFATHAASGDQVNNASAAGKTTWKFSSYTCPNGCSELLKNTLDQQIGSSIDFSGESPWTVGTADTCEKTIEIQGKKTSTTNLQKTINLGLPPEKRLSAESLGITTPETWLFKVTCLTIHATAELHRFIQRNESQLIVIDEEASILVYK